jgi:SPP1 gp7 family putative phage head morphogenesis protein
MFAQRVAGYAAAPTEAALARAASSMLFLGASPDLQWEEAGRRLAFRVGAATRNAAAAGTQAQQLVAQVTGGGGMFEQAAREARQFADAGTQAAAAAGREAAWRANGVDSLMWFAILDPSVCPDCGMRSGKLYTIDRKPIGHSVPLVRDPPYHPNCRCMLVPQRHAGGTLPAGGGAKADSFERFLGTLNPDEQADLLGVGRADLWRSGVITLRDLIGQGGQVMTLGQLRSAGVGPP